MLIGAKARQERLQRVAREAVSLGQADYGSKPSNVLTFCDLSLMGGELTNDFRINTSLSVIVSNCTFLFLCKGLLYDCP